MVRFRPWWLLLVPGLAWAQTVTPPSLTVGGQTSVSGSCSVGAQLVVTWDASGLAGAPCGDMQIWATTASACEPGGAPDGGVITTVSSAVLSQGTGQVIVPDDQLPGLSAADCAASGGVNVTDLLCADVPVSQLFSCTISVFPTPLTVMFNNQPPPTPVISGIDVLDKSLLVHVAAPGSGAVASTNAFWRPSTADAGSTACASDSSWQSMNSTGTQLYNITIGGLTNGQPYDVCVQFVGPISYGSIASPYSAVSQATPMAINSFYSAYTQAGGKAGGCSSAPEIALLLPAGAAALWLFRRRCP